MIIADHSGLVCFANRQASALFGYPHEELIGKPVEYLLPERFRERHPAQRQAYTRNVRFRPMGIGLELFGQRRDGSEFPVEISLSPVEDEDERRVLVAAAIRDVTDRKRIEAELRHLQSITDTALSSESTGALIRALLARLRAALHSDTTTILMTDANGQQLTPYASDGLEAEVGGEIQVPIARGVAGRIAMSDGPLIFDDLTETEVVSPILRSRVRSLVGTPLRRGGHLVGVVHAGSSSPRKFTKDDARLLSLAADRIGMAIERARLYELEQVARRAADAANQSKSRFLATASHDLRQPLQTLALLNGALRRTDQDSPATEMLEQQEQAIGAMARLLNALLDISKLESGAVKPDPSDFTVAALFEELRTEFAGLAANKGLSFKVETCEDCVHSDPTLVGQILRNLVSNAIRYTHAGWVALRCLHESPFFVRIEVLDTGIGIAAEHLRYIYDEFYQVGIAANRTREGYGLGLSIVQRLVTLLDVKLDVRSEVGKGSLFALTLPAGAGDPRVTRGIGAQRPAPVMHTEAHILLVEDDAAVRNATRMLLKSDGYRVTAVASIAEALEQVAHAPRVDLLVTDYHLADGETGTQVIASVRAALDRPLKAILVTGDTSTAMATLPPDPLMRVASKPVDSEQLLNLLRALLADDRL